nr:MAG TPA: hypothetical protein [Caudoviricetes sp.]DAY87809.1 MAG TPA: hypothetical protein [Caudoviricetes sp.]
MPDEGCPFLEMVRPPLQLSFLIDYHYADRLKE